MIFLFYVFVLISLLSALCVITSKNSVRAVFALVLCFISTSFLWVVSGAEFLGITLVLVYVGAVLVLFLFVVMMLDVELASITSGFTRFFPLSIIVSSLFLFLITNSFSSISDLKENMLGYLFVDSEGNNTLQVGLKMFSSYLHEFIIAGIILLTAMIAAISLTFRNKKSSKRISVEEQLQATKETRVKLIG